MVNSGAEHRLTGVANGDRIGHGLINTLLAAAASGATFYLLQRSGECRKPARHLKRRVFLSTVNAMLAGMVAVAGGAIGYNPWSAVIIGFVASLSFLLWSKLIAKFQIDDPVETAAGASRLFSRRKLDFVSLSFSAHRWWSVGNLRRADLPTHGRRRSRWSVRRRRFLLDRLSNRAR